MAFGSHVWPFLILLSVGSCVFLLDESYAGSPPPSSQTVGPSDASAGLMLITPTDHTIQCHGESHWLLARKAGSITAFRHLDLTVHNVVSTPSITLAGPSSDLVINGRDEEAIERVRILRDATAGGGGRNEYTIKKQQQKPRKTTPTVCAAAETTSIWKWNQRYKRQTSGTEKKTKFLFSSSSKRRSRLFPLFFEYL